CPNSPERRKFLKFTKAVRGIIVQLTKCYEGEKNMSASVHYHLSDFEGGLRRTDLLANFYHYAEYFGITPERLLELIHEHAPKG
ncbi:hypothetical protein EBT31_11640, partial [bacterium]|nr:hypothetical protein [bacterium]